jgi:ABC-type hemin transport system substrate-binding protein
MGIPAVSFNTLRFANRLKAAGILPEHAEAEAEALAEAFAVNFKDLATKEDVKREARELRKDIDAQLIQLEQRMDTKIERSKIDLIKWIVGSMLAQFGLLAGLMISVIKFLKLLT